MKGFVLQESKLKRLLLNNQIICAHAYPEYWKLLNEEDIRENVERFAEEADYKLCYNARGECYFLIDSAVNILEDASGEARRNFEKSVENVYHFDVTQLKAMMEFLVFLADVGAGSSVIAPGGEIRLDGIVSRVERKGEIVVRKLNEIEKYNFYRLTKASSAGSPIDRIKRLMGVLVDRGFFIENVHGTSYRATGKIAFYWDMIELEVERLSISAEDESDDVEQLDLSSEERDDDGQI